MSVVERFGLSAARVKREELATGRPGCQITLANKGKTFGPIRLSEAVLLGIVLSEVGIASEVRAKAPGASRWLPVTDAFEPAPGRVV